MSMLAIKDVFDTTVSVAQGALKTTTTNGTGVDLANANANMFVFLPGAITDGTHTPKLQESDSSGSGYTDVAAADQVGTLAALSANTVQQVSYIGSKRYVRAVVTVTGSPATGGFYGVYAITKLRKQP